MKIPFPKNFRLLKFMNAAHNPLVRGTFAIVAWAGVIVTTGRLVLASEIARRFFIEDNFKLALRRCAWYARRSWINLHVSKDEMFDFTEGLDVSELRAIDQFIDGRKYKTPTLLYGADKTYVAARLLSLTETENAYVLQASMLRKCVDRLLMDAAAKIEERLERAKPRPPSRRPDFPITNAHTALSDFAALFPIVNYPWFLISGTFLGLVREGNFLAHDYDIDLGILSGHIDFDAVADTLDNSPNFTLRRFDMHHFSTRNGDRTPVLLKVTHYLGVHIDLFIHYREGDIIWHGSSLHRWNNSAFNLSEYDFHGLKVLGPEDEETYLTENYGAWRVPVVDFNCTTDTPNMSIVEHPVSVAIFLRKMLLDTRLGTERSIQLCQMLEDEGYIVLHDEEKSIYRMGRDISKSNAAS